MHGQKIWSSQLPANEQAMHFYSISSADNNQPQSAQQTCVWVRHAIGTQVVVSGVRLATKDTLHDTVSQCQVG